MNQRTMLLISAITLLTGCNTSSSDVLVHLECPTHITKFEKGVSTSGFVERCNGSPDEIDKRDDGRYIYVYAPTPNGVPVYLFNAEHKLIKAVNYQTNIGKAPE